jgi:hypothetical protein
LLESQAVWGDDRDYQESLRMFHLLIQRLKLARLIYYYAAEDGDPNTQGEDYKILFIDIKAHNKDEFSSKLANAVQGIEHLLRPKLTLKQRSRRQ